jgi:hypothetical protein
MTMLIPLATKPSFLSCCSILGIIVNAVIIPKGYPAGTMYIVGQVMNVNMKVPIPTDIEARQTLAFQLGISGLKVIVGESGKYFLDWVSGNH